METRLEQNHGLDRSGPTVFFQVTLKHFVANNDVAKSNRRQQAGGFIANFYSNKHHLGGWSSILHKDSCSSYVSLVWTMFRRSQRQTRHEEAALTVCPQASTNELRVAVLVLKGSEPAPRTEIQQQQEDDRLDRQHRGHSPRKTAGGKKAPKLSSSRRSLAARAPVVCVLQVGADYKARSITATHKLSGAERLICEREGHRSAPSPGNNAHS